MSLKYLATVFILCALVVGAFFLLQQYISPQGGEPIPSGDQQYSNEEYGLSFTYPEEYVLLVSWTLRGARCVSIT
ncbi:MAG TPA: hypothetical protein VJG64_02060 [Candidatus Paceibacterota bacterium]